MFLGAPVNRHAAKQEPPTATGMGEFLNHLQMKVVHKDTATVPAPINKVQDWHSIPSGYASYSCTQSWVTLDMSILPQQPRNAFCDSALCHGSCLSLLCSTPKSSPQHAEVPSPSFQIQEILPWCRIICQKQQNWEIIFYLFLIKVSRDMWYRMYWGVFSEH